MTKIYLGKNMDKESEKLIKSQLKNPNDFKKFKRMISETKAYDVP